MANVLNRATFEYKRSVNASDFDPALWLVDPDLSRVSGFPLRQWKVVEDRVVLMGQVERYAVEAALAATPTDFLQGATA